jgi:hypothetical protein
MRRFIFFLFFIVIGFGRSVAQTIITDRPDQTESSSTVEQGSLQIESGFLIAYAEDSIWSICHLQTPSILFRFGISKGIELRVLSQFESLKNQNTTTEISGISDLEIGTKIQIYKRESSNTEVAFLSHLRMPTGSNGLTTGKYGSINKLSISHALGEDYGLGYNVGYNYFGFGKGIITYSIALSYKISEKAGIYIEPYGDFLNIEEHFANIDAGMTYLIKDNMQLDFSFGTGLNYSMNYMAIGFSWKIKKD